MIALFVFAVGVGTIFPSIVKVQQERQTIRQERIAEEVLHYHYYKYFFDGEEAKETVVVNGEVIYFLTVKEESKESVLCISWEGENRRGYERCLSFKNR